MMETPIAATPISRVPTPAPIKVELSATEKRRLSQASGSFKTTPETRSLKRVRISQQDAPVGEVEQFYQMSGGQIPMETIAGWVKQKTSDAARSMLFSAGESFFHQLRLSNQMALATRGDMRLREEIKQLKLDMQAAESEKKKMSEAGKRLKGELSVLAKEKDKLGKLVATQEEEKKERMVVHASEIKELKLQVDSLQASVRRLKEALPERYNLGFAKGATDYMRSTWQVMPDLNWALLGEDAVKQVENFKAEAAKAIPKSPITLKDTIEDAQDTKVEAPAGAVEVTPGDAIKKVDPVEDSPSSEATKDLSSPQ